MEETEFYPMTDIPDKEQPVDNFSKTVLIYELDHDSKNMYDFAFGYYNFNTSSWYLHDGELVASCWAYMPIPKDMKNRHFKTVNIG